MCKLKFWVLAFIVSVPFRYANADWIDSFIVEQYPFIKQAPLNAQYPQLSAWLTEIIGKMENEMNSSLPTNIPQKRLKGLYLYQTMKQEASPSVLRRRNEGGYAVFIDSAFMRRLFHGLEDPSSSPIVQSAHILRVKLGNHPPG